MQRFTVYLEAGYFSAEQRLEYGNTAEEVYSAVNQSLAEEGLPLRVKSVVEDDCDYFVVLCQRHFSVIGWETESIHGPFRSIPSAKLWMMKPDNVLDPEDKRFRYVIEHCKP